MSNQKTYEIIDGQKCIVCGEMYGRTNLKFMGKTDVWVACNCHPKDKVYFINTTNIVVTKELSNE